MPRLTQRQYDANYQQLRVIWKSDRARLLHLSPTHQMVLHEYYRFTESVCPDGLRRHRKIIDRAIPTLAQSAGRALRTVNSENLKLHQPKPLVTPFA